MNLWWWVPQCRLCRKQRVSQRWVHIQENWPSSLLTSHVSRGRVMAECHDFLVLPSSSLCSHLVELRFTHISQKLRMARDLLLHAACKPQNWYFYPNFPACYTSTAGSRWLSQFSWCIQYMNMPWIQSHNDSSCLGLQSTLPTYQDPWVLRMDVCWPAKGRLCFLDRKASLWDSQSYPLHSCEFEPPHPLTNHWNVGEF